MPRDRREGALLNFDELFSPDGLLQAVLAIKRKRTDLWDVLMSRHHPRVKVPCGVDHVPFSAFYSEESEKSRNRRAKLLKRLSRDALQGRFVFLPFSEIDKPKGTLRPKLLPDVSPLSGETRSISVCCARDAIVQHILLEQLKSDLESCLSDCCYGYRTGRSASTAVRRIRRLISKGWTFAYESDIRKFFDRVPHAPLLAITKSSLPHWDKRAHRLLREFITSRRIESSNFDSQGRLKTGVNWLEAAQKRKQGLPQGGALSGFLTNLYLRSFDQAMTKPELRMFRYADDFIILSRSQKALESAVIEAQTHLEQLGLELHPDKSRFVDLSQGVALDFLGYRLRLIQHKVTTRIKPETLKRRYYSLLELFYEARRIKLCPKTLHKRLLFKVFGLDFDSWFSQDPTASEKLKELGLSVAPSRSWMRYFKLIDSFGQLRELDIWVKKSFQRHNRLMRRTSHQKACEFCNDPNLKLPWFDYCTVFRNIKREAEKHKKEVAKSV